MGRRKDIEKKKKAHEATKEALKVSEQDWKYWQEKLKKDIEGQSENSGSYDRLRILVEQTLQKSKEEIDSSEDALSKDLTQSKSLKELEDKLPEDKWKNHSKLSLLIAAGENVPGELDKIKPNTCCDEAHEYYGCISGEGAEDIFSRVFMEILGALRD